MLVQGYLDHKNNPPPWDHYRSMSIGIGLLWGPTGWMFLTSKVPLHKSAGLSLGESGSPPKIAVGEACGYRGTSLIRNTHPPGITLGPYG